MRIHSNSNLNPIQILVFVSDSTVLAHALTVLNERYNYGVELFLLSVDEGIAGYRDDSLEVGLRTFIVTSSFITTITLSILIYETTR